ncbi:MAG TPA: HAMP domain-containing histidine kinase [Geoalkalibacter subterraneus]|uniref:histidine kinase n=1 Tax=Geoalkalibacter subterraneus TaxID=483547 RepID=A0A831PPA0_9BACT|nr:HAMP domain-containing histidine kinase [Geoalkalibacter subterraneus]
MKLFRRLFHPLLTFIGIQVLWIMVLIFWIYWFLGRHRQLKELAIEYQAEWLPQKTDWLILTEGILLLVAILVGIYVIFIYWRRQSALYKAQQRFISQVTHELKSPLASLQLHLETIQMRPPSHDQLNQFVSLMKKDCIRLDGMINNLLNASRIQHKDSLLNLQRGNLSQAIETYLRSKRAGLPPGTDLDWTIEPGLVANFDVDALETVLRNLIENAVLYSEGAPRIRIEMKRNAGMAHLIFSDSGYGIPRQLRKKIFTMFYRIRHPGKSIRGSGLGLFIVHNIVKLHNGRIWLDTTTQQQGSTFHLLLPLITTGPPA